MSLTAAEVVEFLEREDVLEVPNESPWPTTEVGEDLRPVDWGRLLPTRRPARDGADWDLHGDDWHPEFDEDFFGEIEGRIGRGAAALDSESTSRRPDVCAWYQPLHFHGLDWGIYIREDCLRRMAGDIAAFLPPGTPVTRLLPKALLRSAFSTLFLHEAYHHKTESLGIRLHIVERLACYGPYFRNVYDPLRSAKSIDLHEEALANAESFIRLSEAAYRKWLSKPVFDATRSYLRWRFPFDPPGYDQAPKFLKPDPFDRCEWLLKSQVQEHTVKPFRTGSDWKLAPRVNQSLFTLRSDIWTIVSPGATPILPTSSPYPSVSSRALEGALTADGYQRVKGGGKGSHVKLSAPGRPVIVLPGGRKDLSPVVVRNVAKALGFSSADELRAGLGL